MADLSRPASQVLARRSTTLLRRSIHTSCFDSLRVSAPPAVLEMLSQSALYRAPSLQNLGKTWMEEDEEEEEEDIVDVSVDGEDVDMKMNDGKRRRRRKEEEEEEEITIMNEKEDEWREREREEGDIYLLSFGAPAVPSLSSSSSSHAECLCFSTRKWHDQHDQFNQFNQFNQPMNSTLWKRTSSSSSHVYPFHYEYQEFPCQCNQCAKKLYANPMDTLYALLHLLAYAMRKEEEDVILSETYLGMMMIMMMMITMMMIVKDDYNIIDRSIHGYYV